MERKLLTKGSVHIEKLPQFEMTESCINKGKEMIECRDKAEVKNIVKAPFCNTVLWSDRCCVTILTQHS